MARKKSVANKLSNIGTAQIIAKLLVRAETDPNVLEDAFQLNRQLRDEGAVDIDGRKVYDQDNFDRSVENSAAIRRLCAAWIKTAGLDKCVDIYKRTLLFDAPNSFDAYCRYIEWDRPTKKRFYEPRRKQLLPIANAMQDLADGKLELLAISLPPGVGKTTLSLFFLTWFLGRRPDLTALGGSHSNSFLHGIYDEIIRVLDRNGEYLYNDVFPNAPMVDTNSKDMRIDLVKPKRFQNYQFSSIGSGNAGKVRASGILYCDDLVDGIETAMSRDRLDKLWQQYYTDLRQRKMGGGDVQTKYGTTNNVCKELHVATRWSIADPIGRLESQYEGNPAAKFLRFPALDENDESNFDYPYGVGFTTDFYRQQRDIMDQPSWEALYMNEPIEREGQLYAPDELRWFFSLPEAAPDAIIAICDTKEQGNDYLAMPIFKQYGEDYYLDTWICDNGKVEILVKRVANALKENNVRLCRIESNRGGTLFAKEVQQELRQIGGTTTITTKWTQTNKETRIQVNSGWVKEHILFRDSTVSNREYKTAMNQLVKYTMAGKNKHDDIPDVLSLFVDMVASSELNVAKIMRRPF